jgi:hypothetical protein
MAHIHADYDQYQRNAAFVVVNCVCMLQLNSCVLHAAVFLLKPKP